MKIKEFAKKLIAVTFAAALILSAGFSSFAVDEEIIDDPVIIGDTEVEIPEETDYEEPASEAVTDEDVTEPLTQEETYEATDEYTDPVTEEETQPATDEEIGATEYQDDVDETVASKKPVSQDSRVEVEKKIPTAITTTQDDGDLTYGYVSWACVIVGVIVVLIVLVSNKTRYYGGEGKLRYSEGNRITGQQKRLLDDDYYKTRKYNSYYNKDTRK